MGFEPRARGKRFGRSVAKKKPARDRREKQEAPLAYEEHVPTDPSQVRSVTLNYLEHLGNQRFALPPFSEHFQRWMKDVGTLMSDFETQLPQAIDQQYKESIHKTLSNLQIALRERAETETSNSNRLSDAQRQIATYESELSKLDREYKTLTHEVRRRYDQSFEKLGREIDTLDQQRLRILHTRATLIQRVFGRSQVDLEDKAKILRLKKNTLGDRKEQLKQDLENHRGEYERERRSVTEELAALHKKLGESKNSNIDDALEIRREACEELRRNIGEAVDRLLNLQEYEKVESKRERVDGGSRG